MMHACLGACVCTCSRRVQLFQPIRTAHRQGTEESSMQQASASRYMWVACRQLDCTWMVRSAKRGIATTTATTRGTKPTGRRLRCIWRASMHNTQTYQTSTAPALCRYATLCRADFMPCGAHGGPQHACPGPRPQTPSPKPARLMLPEKPRAERILLWRCAGGYARMLVRLPCCLLACSMRAACLLDARLLALLLLACLLAGCAHHQHCVVPQAPCTAPVGVCVPLGWCWQCCAKWCCVLCHHLQGGCGVERRSRA